MILQEIVQEKRCSFIADSGRSTNLVAVYCSKYAASKPPGCYVFSSGEL